MSSQHCPDSDVQSKTHSLNLNRTACSIPSRLLFSEPKRQSFFDANQARAVNAVQEQTQKRVKVQWCSSLFLIVLICMVCLYCINKDSDAVITASRRRKPNKSNPIAIMLYPPHTEMRARCQQTSRTTFLDTSS